MTDKVLKENHGRIEFCVFDENSEQQQATQFLEHMHSYGHKYAKEVGVNVINSSLAIWNNYEDKK